MTTVYVAIYEHRHGQDVSVHATAEGAEACAREIAESNWHQEIGRWHPEIIKPSDPTGMAGAYFANVEDEFFDVRECEVQS